MHAWVVFYTGAQSVGLCENIASKTHNAVIVIIITITLSFSSSVDKSTVIIVISTATTTDSPAASVEILKTARIEVDLGQD